MEDVTHYEKLAAEALQEAQEERLPNARHKHLTAAAAWKGLAKRIGRVKAAADRNAEAKAHQESFDLGGADSRLRG